METANNRYLSEFYRKLVNLAALTRNMTQKFASIEEQSKADHFRILEALKERKADESERLMKQHLRSTCRAIVKRLMNTNPL